ncbi:MAG: GNAT family N-acetyltransferase [DPANN group archaeon]|nr:GNAT family N-acetyltransferase [DPANN group archaeon]
MALLIRPGEEADIRACFKASRDVPSFTSYHGLDDGGGYRYIKGYKEKGVFLIAKKEGTWVGYALAEITAGNIFYIDILYVKDVHQRKGIGRKLMAALKERAKEAGADSIALFAATDNPGAMAFYESLGLVKKKSYFEFIDPL